jgi:hypothetical protein
LLEPFRYLLRAVTPHFGGLVRVIGGEDYSKNFLPGSIYQIADDVVSIAFLTGL